MNGNYVAVIIIVYVVIHKMPVSGLTVLVSHRSAFVASRVCSHCTLSRIMLSLSLVLVIVRDYVVLVRDYVVLPCSPCVFQGLCCSCVELVCSHCRFH